jgi:hypothetical protein
MTSDHPRVGALSEDPLLTARCHFAPTEQDPPCGRDATVHVISEDATGYRASLLACDRHADVARALATWEHPLDSPCGLPDSMFDARANRCYHQTPDTLGGLVDEGLVDVCGDAS